MARTLAEIEADASALTEEERFNLIGFLSESLRKPMDRVLEEAINTELKRRLSAIETGKAQWLDGDQALASIEARLHAKHAKV